MCLISRGVQKKKKIHLWLPPTLPTADNLVPSPMHLGCCGSFSSASYSTIRHEQRRATYAVVISEGEHTRAHSSHVNILTLSLRQTHRHAHVPPFCLAVRGASLPHTNKHSPTPPPPPPPPLDVRVFSLNFAWLLIWDADGTPACCPVPNTHIWGVKRIIHCFHHTTEVFELKEQLPSHS